MKVAIDTNVLVSSFFGGIPGQILEAWENGAIELCLTPEILREYFEILKRLELSAPRRDALLELFRHGHHCHFTSRTPTLKLCDDPDDDMFLEAAVALKAEAVISGDKALLRVREYVGIRVLTPKEFLRSLPG
jgi:uncharacterized protein